MFVLFSCFKCTCELALTLSLLLSFSFLVLFLKYIARLLFCLFFFKLFLLGEFADDADESAILVTHFANVRAKQLHHLLGFLSEKCQSNEKTKKKLEFSINDENKKTKKKSATENGIDV